MGHSHYKKFQVSELGWINNLPSHWEVKRLRFELNSNPVKSELINLEDELLVTFVPMEAVGENGGMSLELSKPISDVYSGYTYFRDGDVVVAKITPCFENGKGAIAKDLENGLGFGTTEFHVLRASEGLNEKYLFYITLSHPFRKIGTSEMLGAGGQKRIPEEFIKDFRLGIPTPLEQQKIASFLDHKTQQIDQLIEKKKALIETLEEKRIAVITQAVTKGLDKKAKLKPSGIDWLGEVPERWNVERLRFLMVSNPVKSEVASLAGETLVSFVPMEAVAEYGGMNLTQEKMLDEVYSGYTYFKNNDVVIAKITPCFENGKGSLARELINGIGFGTTEFHVLRVLDSLDEEYLFYLSISDPFRAIGASEMLGAGGQKRIPEDFIKDFRLAIPPIEEQREIITFLDGVLAQMNAMKAANDDAIVKLEEYRSAIITSAVTGKIDVREVEMPKEMA